MGFEKKNQSELLSLKLGRSDPAAVPLLSEGVPVLTFTSTPFSSLLSGSDFSSQ